MYRLHFAIANCTLIDVILYNCNDTTCTSSCVHKLQCMTILEKIFAPEQCTMCNLNYIACRVFDKERGSVHCSCAFMKHVHTCT